MGDLQRVVRPSGERLRDLLLTHLQQSGGCAWPGVDGLCVDDVLACYAPAARSGRAPGREQLLAAHPDLAAELAQFFDRLTAVADPPK